MRIGNYTYLRAVAETANGRHYAVRRFIKAAGGRSALASNNPALALDQLGKMKLNFANRSAISALQPVPAAAQM